MSSTRRFSDALDVPDQASEFIQGAEKRAKKHAKTQTDHTVSTSYRINRETHRRLKLAAVQRETSLSDLLDRAINEYLDKLENESRVINDEDDDGI